MTRRIRFSLLACAALGLVACGGPQGPVETSVPDKDVAREDDMARTPARPGTMFEMNYQIIGTPIVGSPVAVDLEIKSAYGEDPINVRYQVPDPSALIMDDTQPRELVSVPRAGESRVRERVTVIPQREGRLYINVRAARDSGDGSTSTMISIPIHVGNVDTSLVEHGELETNDEGETTRVLTAE